MTVRSGSDVERIIERMAREIVETFHPQAVILFGSHGRRDAGADSDADFLVVMDVTGTRRDAANAIRRSLRNREIPVDVVVVTPEQFERDRRTVGTLVRPAVLEGRVLYSRAA